MEALQKSTNELYSICFPADRLSYVMLLWTSYLPQLPFYMKPAKFEDQVSIHTRDAIFAGAIAKDIPSATVRITDKPEVKIGL